MGDQHDGKSGTSITRLEKTGADLVYTIPSNTNLSGHSHLLVYTENEDGESTTSTSTAIIDLAVPTNPASGIIFTDTDTDFGELGGTVNITKATDESDITHYALYWGTDANTKSGAAITEIAKTGANLMYALPANTSIASHTHLLDYTKNAGIKYDVDFHIQAWPNINRFGDYHNLHNHPHSWLSGTYYVSVPSDDPSIGSRNDLNPNNISFYDPRPQANMISINGDKQVDPEFRHNPKSGELLLWPAFLHHFVHPNLCHVERISVSFNIVLKWKKEYLPK